MFADPFNTPNEFPLCHLVHEIDVIDPLLLVLIPLVHGIHPNIAWFAIWEGFPAFSDGNGCWIGFGECPGMRDVLPCAAKIVYMRDGDPPETVEPLVAEHVPLTAEYFFRRLSGQSSMSVVRGDEQGDIFRCVLFRERRTPVSRGWDKASRLLHFSDESCDLRIFISRHLHDVF